MFDDVPENLPTGGVSSTGGDTPVLDMPEVPEPAAPASAPTAPAPVQDMFEAAGEPADAPPSAPQPTLSEPLVIPEPHHGGAGKMIVLLVVIVCVLGIVGVATAWFLGAFSGADTPEPVQTTTPVRTAPIPDQPAVSNEPVVDGAVEPTDKLAPEEPAAQVIEEVDSDGDGLTDAEEAALGTSSFKPDTDNDGLFDFEEVRKYHVNPLNPDTDGDGYLDGEEVRNGYSPSGPGKLFDVPPTE